MGRFDQATAEEEDAVPTVGHKLAREAWAGGAVQRSTATGEAEAGLGCLALRRSRAKLSVRGRWTRGVTPSRCQRAPTCSEGAVV